MNAPFLVCFIMWIAAGVWLAWALRADRADFHALHRPGTCRDCDEP
jgi:hypothetical protein